jgi:hypothetical protein
MFFEGFDVRLSEVMGGAFLDRCTISSLGYDIALV